MSRTLPRGYELGGRHAADPINSHKPRGKARNQRKAAKDGPNWTGTELRKREAFLKQFCKNKEGPGGNSEAYKDNYADVFGHE